MEIASLMTSGGDMAQGMGQPVPIVLRTRIRLARNLASVPFPGWSDERKRRQVLETCLKGLLRAPAMRDATALRLDDLSQLERQVLVERHLISRELMSAKGGAGVVISQDQGCSIMINEEDHLRIQMVGAGMDLQGLWARVNNVDSEIEDVLDYAFSAQLGYLTACPTNIGTGMRASAMMHLPGLVLAGHMDKVVRMVNQIGMAVRGLFGEGSDATGSIFQISNQQTLGESETDIIKRLESVLGAIMEQEENARQKLAEDKTESLWDKMGRARGVLQNGHLLSSEEAMNLLSLTRLAVDMELLPPHWRPVIDRMLVEGQPGHMQLQHGHGELNSSARDALRARLMREQFESLPPLKLTTHPQPN